MIVWIINRHCTWWNREALYIGLLVELKVIPKLYPINCIWLHGKFYKVFDLRLQNVSTAPWTQCSTKMTHGLLHVRMVWLVVYKPKKYIYEPGHDIILVPFLRTRNQVNTHITLKRARIKKYFEHNDNNVLNWYCLWPQLSIWYATYKHVCSSTPSSRMRRTERDVSRREVLGQEYWK